VPTQKLAFVTLELRTARQNEIGPEGMVDFLQSLPTAPNGLQKLFRSAPPFFLEILSANQAICFFVTVPVAQREYIVSQLTAIYPEVKITEHTDNPLSVLEANDPQVTRELTLKHASYYPLQTWKQTNNDPLSSLLTVLSRLQEKETILVQWSLERASDSWKSAGERALQPKDPAHRQPHPDAQAIREKLKFPSFAFSLHITAQAPTKARAEALLESVATGFMVFQTGYNQIKSATTLLSNKTSRTLTDHRVSPRAQYLSSEELASQFHLPHKGLEGIKNLAWGKTLLGEPPENLPTFTHTPEAQRQELNLFAKTEYKNNEQVFGLKTNDRRRHIYTVGKTGTGKSTLLANMIINDLKHDEGVAVIDPHGDLIETVLNYIPKHRVNDTIVFDPSDPESSPQLNIFEGESVVHRELIASSILSIFQKLYAHSWGPRLEYILRNTLLTLLSEEARLQDIIELLTNDRYRAMVVNRLQDPVLRSFWINEFERMPDKLRAESISPILNKVGQFVTSPLVRRVLNARKSSFSIENVMNDKKILLMNVSQGKLGEDTASLLGALLITKLQLAAMNRVTMKEDDRQDFYLYIDEFQNFATTSFVKILSEARKYRLNLTLANQYIAQIPDDVRSAIFGNAGSIISFVTGADDAYHLQKEFGQIYTQEDFVSLDRYQILCKLMIDGQVAHPFPAYTLGLATSRNEGKEKVLRVSRERWAGREPA